jgi:hypothetical protein
MPKEKNPVIVPELGVRFDSFTQGFYSHLGDFLYLVKHKDKIVAHSPVKWGTLGRTIYSHEKGFREDFDVSYLEPENPDQFLQKRMNTLMDFINTYKKLGEK